MIGTSCMSYLSQQVLIRNTELTSHHQLEELGKGQKEIPHVLSPSQNLPWWNPSWLSNVCTSRKDPKSEWLARDDQEINPIPIKPKTEIGSHEAVLGSLTLLLITGAALPNKVSCSVNICVSSDNSLLSVRQEPTLGPCKGSPFLQQKDRSRNTT